MSLLFSFIIFTVNQIKGQSYTNHYNNMLNAMLMCLLSQINQVNLLKIIIFKFIVYNLWMNMFNVLYHKYIEQVKEQEIEKYNERHREYLMRSVKLNNKDKDKENNTKRINSNININGNAYKNNYDDRPIQINSKQEQRKRQFKRPKFEHINPNSNSNTNKQIQSFNKKQNDQYKQSQMIKNPQNKRQMNFENNKPYNQYQQYQKETSLVQNIYHEKDSRQFRTNTNWSQNQKHEPQQRQIKTKDKVLTFQQQVQQSQNVVLIECPQGCGRKFNQKVIQKHAKNCRKIFQQKRKPFKVKVVQPEAENVKKQQKKESTSASTKSKVPKWKKQSEELRKTIGINPKTNQQTKTNQVNQAPPQDDRVQCGGCGRKFNEKAAQKHIPNCLKRNKK